MPKTTRIEFAYKTFLTNTRIVVRSPSRIVPNSHVKMCNKILQIKFKMHVMNNQKWTLLRKLLLSKNTRLIIVCCMHLRGFVCICVCVFVCVCTHSYEFWSFVWCKAHNSSGVLHSKILFEQNPFSDRLWHAFWIIFEVVFCTS